MYQTVKCSWEVDPDQVGSITIIDSNSGYDLVLKFPSQTRLMRKKKQCTITRLRIPSQDCEYHLKTENNISRLWIPSQDWEYRLKNVNTVKTEKPLTKKPSRLRVGLEPATDYKKSVLTSCPDRCDHFCKSATDTAVTLLPQILLLYSARRISLWGTATVNAALPSEVYSHASGPDFYSD